MPGAGPGERPPSHQPCRPLVWDVRPPNWGRIQSRWWRPRLGSFVLESNRVNRPWPGFLVCDVGWRGGHRRAAPVGDPVPPSSSPPARPGAVAAHCWEAPCAPPPPRLTARPRASLSRPPAGQPHRLPGPVSRGFPAPDRRGAGQAFPPERPALRQRGCELPVRRPPSHVVAPPKQG